MNGRLCPPRAWARREPSGQAVGSAVALPPRRAAPYFSARDRRYGASFSTGRRAQNVTSRVVITRTGDRSGRGAGRASAGAGATKKKSKRDKKKRGCPRGRKRYMLAE